MHHEIVYRLTFPAQDAAILKIASSYIFWRRVRLCFKPYNSVIVRTKTKNALQWNYKRRCTFYGWWLHEIWMPCRKSIIIALAAVIAVSLYHSWLRPIVFSSKESDYQSWNENDECFKWAIVRALNPVEKTLNVLIENVVKNQRFSIGSFQSF